MGTKVGLAGASGYAGGELLRLLLGHPDLTVGPVCASSAAGRPVTDLHPHLPQLGHLTVLSALPDVLSEAAATVPATASYGRDR